MPETETLQIHASNPSRPQQAAVAAAPETNPLNCTTRNPPAPGTLVFSFTQPEMRKNTGKCEPKLPDGSKMAENGQEMVGKRQKIRQLEP